MVTKRVRKRYLALRVESDQHVNERDLMDAVWNAVLNLFGEYGASQTNLRLIKYDPERSYMVVHCSHLALENVRASIASITEIQGKPAVIHVMGVSGTLKGLRKKALM
jgi:ribonuclease P/MRP protein subunit POP5